MTNMSETMEAIQQDFVAGMLPGARSGGDSLAKSTLPGRMPQSDDEIVTLVHQIFFNERKTPLHTVMFSGLDHGSGCTRLSAAAALALARSTSSVCLVEVNLHTPSLAKLFGLQERRGFSQSLTSDEPIGSYVEPLNKNLSLVQAGFSSSDTSALLMPDRVKNRLAELSAMFRFIILDSAPLSYVETLMFGHLSSGIVMILEANKTRRDEAVSAAGILRSSGIEILGAVLNKRTLAMPSKLYHRL